MTSDLERWHEVPSLGLATPGSSESPVSSTTLFMAIWLTTPLARICYAYQHLHDIGRFEPIPRKRPRNERVFTDVAKKIYQNVTAEKMRLVRFLLGREQSFEKNDQQLSASIEVR